MLIIIKYVLKYTRGKQMKKLFLLSITIFLSISIFASIDFQMEQIFSSDEITINKLASKDGKLFILGSDQEDDMYFGIMKNDSIIYERRISGEKEEYLSDIIFSGDDIFLLGFSDSKTEMFSDQRGFGDIILIKMNSNYEIEWLKNYGGNFADVGNSIIESSDGYLYIAGYTNSPQIENYNNLEDSFVIKIDKNGNEIWAKASGTEHVEQFNDIIQVDDNFVVTGYRSINDKSVACNYTDTNVILAEITPEGNLLWEKVYGGFYEEEGFSIAEKDESFYVLCSREDVSSFLSEGYGKFDFWLLKTDFEGNIQEKYIYGGSSFDIPSEMIMTESELLLAGTTRSNDEVLKMYKRDKDKDIVIFEVDFSGKIIDAYIIGNEEDNNFDYAVLAGNELFVAFSDLYNNYILK